jgi:hypothetical protein
MSGSFQEDCDELQRALNALILELMKPFEWLLDKIQRLVSR